MKKDTNKYLSTQLYIHPYIFLFTNQVGLYNIEESITQGTKGKARTHTKLASEKKDVGMNVQLCTEILVGVIFHDSASPKYPFILEK